MSLKVQLESLTHDAGLWRDSASVLADAASAASGLSVGNACSFAGHSSGLTATYAALMAHAQQMLSGGAEEMNAIATTLGEVRDVYSSSDVTERQRYDGLWEPRS